MKIKILLSARIDLVEGRDFYEQQDEGAGGYFVDSIMGDIMGLEHTAGIHRRFFGLHRLIATRFPHAIYYKVINDEALVFRVLDCRRNPRWIARELRTVQ